MENLTKEELLVIVKNVSPMLLNYITICRHFDFTEEEMRQYGAGEKIVNRVKNLETYMLLSKAENDKPQEPQA